MRLEVGKYWYLIGAVLALGGCVFVVTREHVDLASAAVSYLLFAVGFGLAIPLWKLIGRRSRGTWLHVWRAVVAAMLVGPILIGPEGTWVPSVGVPGALAGGAVYWAIRDPATLTTLPLAVYWCVVGLTAAGVAGWLGPMLVFLAAWCFSVWAATGGVPVRGPRRAPKRAAWSDDVRE